MVNNSTCFSFGEEVIIAYSYSGIWVTDYYALEGVSLSFQGLVVLECLEERIDLKI